MICMSCMGSSEDQRNMFFRTNNPTVNSTSDFEKHRLWLDVVSNQDASYKQILVGYAESATYDFDRGFDGEFFDLFFNNFMWILKIQRARNVLKM